MKIALFGLIVLLAGCNTPPQESGAVGFPPLAFGATGQHLVGNQYAYELVVLGSESGIDWNAFTFTVTGDPSCHATKPTGELHPNDAVVVAASQGASCNLAGTYQGTPLGSWTLAPTHPERVVTETYTSPPSNSTTSSPPPTPSSTTTSSPPPQGNQTGGQPQ